MDIWRATLLQAVGGMTLNKVIWQGVAADSDEARRLAQEAASGQETDCADMVVAPFHPNLESRPELRPAVESVQETLEAMATFELLTNWRHVEYSHLKSPATLQTWMRGQSDAAWALSPSLERNPAYLFYARMKPGKTSTHPRGREALRHERGVNREFVRRGFAFRRDLGDPTDAYFTARHYGLPSRLVDWTRAPLAALFFACSEHLDRDGRLFFLDVGWPYESADLQHWPIPVERVVAAARSKKEPLTQSSPMVAEVVNHLFEGEAVLSRAVLPIIPRLLDQRMVMQEARFTLHPPEHESLAEPYLHSVLVPRAAKLWILRELTRLAVRWDTLFPDLEHIARDLSQTWVNLYPSHPQWRRKFLFIEPTFDGLHEVVDRYHRLPDEPPGTDPILPPRSSPGTEPGPPTSGPTGTSAGTP